MQVPVGFDYVLVLQWLAGRDEPTGVSLHEFMQSIGYRSEFFVCRSWDDIERALVVARDAADAKGIPIVHLETHGADPWEGNAEQGVGFGPARDSAAAWSRFGAILAPLNVRAGFQLLVVSAACWGSGIIAAIEAGDHPAPFACAVGLRTEVAEGRLRDCMRELYRRLMDSTLEESVASAQRELGAGQELRLEVIVDLAARMLVTVLRRRRIWRMVGPHRRLRRARRLWDSWFPRDLQEREPVYRFENIGLMP